MRAGQPPGPPAVVLGDIEVVHALGRAGIRSTVVARPGATTRRSRYAVGAIDAPTAPTAEDDERLLAALLEHADRAAEPPVLFFDSDEAVDFLARHRHRLEPRLRFTLAPPDLIADLGDKHRFQELARRLDLPVPRARLLRGAPSAGDADPLELPVLLKPVPHRGERWRNVAGSAKALTAATRDELDAIRRALADERVDVLAQELVPGPETEIVSYHVYVTTAGRTAGEFTGKKIRTWPSEYGMSTALVTTGEADVAELGRELVARLGLRGPAKLDFKRSPDGGLRLLEVNARLTLWVHPGAVAGVNLAELMYRDLAGLPLPPPARARAGVRWVHLRNDRPAARDAGIGTARWAAWALRCHTNSMFSWRDLGPVLAKIPGSPRAGR